MVAKNRSNELRLTRVYDAPIQLVWDAWTDPEQAAQWWGPRGFTLTTHSKDLRPGGTWHYTMHGPDGVDYPNKTFYHEVKKHSKLVYDHGAYDDRPPMFRVTVLFSEANGKTTMDMTMTLPTPEEAEQARKFVKKAGGEATWDRLAEYLENKISGRQKFVINRVFDVPRNVLFEMWTDPKHFSQWLAPQGFTMEFIKSDISPGGRTFYFMQNDAGIRFHGKTEYLEVRKLDRIVYTQQFCDEEEKVSRHPFAPTWPETLLTTVTLTEENPERTRVTVTFEPHGSTTPEERDVFIQSKGSMTQGWTGSFDKLEEYLEVNLKSIAANF